MRSTSTRWLALLVVCAACLPYLATIDDYFTQDDFGVVQLLAGKPWTTFPQWFAMPWMEHIWGFTPDEIRPFVAFTYQVTAVPAPGRPEAHHVFNILMHAANALLVMVVARVAVQLSRPAAGFAGVAFALLPVHAESVAWITGRVDSMPAFFYTATFLAYVQWRRGAGFIATDRRGVGRHGWYGLALALFFVALFSKQNTITMVATLVAYDLLVLDRARRGTPAACLGAWLPFALMTAGYLGLRRALFGASVRGGIESEQQLTAAAGMIERHLLRTVFGHAGPVATWEWVALAAILTGCLLFLMRQPRHIGHALALGVAWWGIGVAPVLVAGYESPRHVYLAAVGWAVLLGMFWEAANHAAPARGFRSWRVAPIAVAVACASLYAGRLHGEVETWASRARVSKIAVDRVSREAASAPEGTLLLVSVPHTSWEWALPFALQPPYSPSDLSSRINLVAPSRLYCCGAAQWNAFTRERLRAWLDSGAPVVAVHVAPEDGNVSTAIDAEMPELRTLARVLAETDSPHALNAAIVRLLEHVVRQP